ncbi:MAG: hypothetical protein HKN91_13630 [Acidimicrobiia bacterium]|nr:hypothetical protein [Acidimicrobiia bacterium]
MIQPAHELEDLLSEPLALYEIEGGRAYSTTKPRDIWWGIVAGAVGIAVMAAIYSALWSALAAFPG